MLMMFYPVDLAIGMGSLGFDEAFIIVNCMYILCFASLSSFCYHGRCERVLGNLHLQDKQQLGVTDCYTFVG